MKKLSIIAEQPDNRGELNYFRAGTGHDRNSFITGPLHRRNTPVANSRVGRVNYFTPDRVAGELMSPRRVGSAEFCECLSRPGLSLGGAVLPWWRPLSGALPAMYGR